MDETKYLIFEETKDYPFSTQQAWDLLSNTEHLNRIIGLPPVIYSQPMVTDQEIYRWAHASLKGLAKLKWKEYPFNWVKPEEYHVRRVYENGPFVEMFAFINIDPTESGCRLTVKVKIQPRNLLGRWITQLAGGKMLGDCLRYCSQYQANHASERDGELPGAKPVILNLPQLQACQSRLTKDTTVPQDYLEKLIHHLSHSTDEQVLGMQPYAIADLALLDRKQMLRTFLHATRSGMLDLKWKLMCPNCRVPNVEYSSLSELSPKFHCDFCGVDYVADLDQYTELRFDVNPSIREAQQAIFCMGGPVNSPHILVQQSLQPGEKQQFSLTLHPEEEGLRLRALHYNHNFVFRTTLVDKSVHPYEIAYDGTAWHSQHDFLTPGRITISVENKGPHLLIFALEKMAWNNQAVSAAVVTNMEEFRAWFSSEVLAPGLDIAVKRICIFFSDLKSSTQLYEQVGDAPAFARVQRHFDFLLQTIRESNGTIIKTIGDAVMAAFLHPVDGLRAALQIQRGLDAFNLKNNFTPPIVVKIGMHQGPAIAVNANGLMDYFGRTVNIAARIQNESEGEDIVCDEEFLTEPGVKELLNEFTVQQQSFSQTLKGIEGHFALCRLRLQ